MAAFACADVARFPAGLCARLPEHPFRRRAVHFAGHADQRIHRHLPAAGDHGPLPAEKQIFRGADRRTARRGVPRLRMRGGAGDPAAGEKRPAGLLRAHLHARRPDREPHHRAEHVESLPRPGRGDDDEFAAPARFPHRGGRGNHRFQTIARLGAEAIAGRKLGKGPGEIRPRPLRLRPRASARRQPVSRRLPLCDEGLRRCRGLFRHRRVDHRAVQHRHRPRRAMARRSRERPDCGAGRADGPRVHPQPVQHLGRVHRGDLG